MRLAKTIDPDRPAVVVTVETEGAWTPGPCVSVEAGSAVELTEPELVWLIDEGLPAALVALRAAIEPPGAPGEQTTDGSKGEASRPVVLGRLPAGQGEHARKGIKGAPTPARLEPVESSDDDPPAAA